MKNLFIDSNIWLSLYHFTNDDLEQFSKLKDLNGKDIRLFIPQQVCDEVYRNRESKLLDAFESFKIQTVKFPVFCKDYDEYQDFNRDYKKLLNRYKLWKDKIDIDIQNNNLPADKILHEFFEISEIIECESIIEKAYSRYRIGNPPGKDNKYGDAINWECLLKTVPYKEDLYLISSDKDYRSKMFNDKINPFLQNEWKIKKNSNVIFYTNLVHFLDEHLNDIKLKTEQEKQQLIEKLNTSCSFANTHGIIAMLNKYTGWSESQIEDICNAVEKNSQVGSIIDDNDIFNFYFSILSKINYKELPDCSTKRVMELIFIDIGEKLSNSKFDYEAERDNTFEEYFKH